MTNRQKAAQILLVAADNDDRRIVDIVEEYVDKWDLTVQDIAEVYTEIDNLLNEQTENQLTN